MVDAGPDWPRLVSLLVHELRTPVNVAGGYLKMLLDRRTGQLDDRQQQMVSQASRSVDTITALLADASDLARLERGEGRPAVRQGDLAAMVRSAAAAFTPPHDSHVTVACGVSVTNASIGGDIERLKRAISTCLAAVAREVPADGQLIVELGDGPDQTIVLLVADARLAASLKAAPPAWGPLDETRGGLGLDLPLARCAAAIAGGRLESPATGTRQPALRLVLPRAR